MPAMQPDASGSAIPARIAPDSGLTWDDLSVCHKAPREFFSDDQIRMGDLALRHSLGVGRDPGDSYWVLRAVAPLMMRDLYAQVDEAAGESDVIDVRDVLKLIGRWVG